MVAAFYGLVVVFLAILLAVGGLVLVEYLVPWHLRREHNDVAGFIYAVLGVMYAVLLAFMTIVAWEDFELARSTTESEANSMAELFWLAGEFPDPEGRQIQELVRSYAKVVTDEEWALMEQGRASPRAWDLTDEIRSSIYGFEPDSAAEQVLYDQGLTLARDLVDERRLRLLEAREGIPHILWGVVVVGGIIVVGFTYLFGLENTWSHTLMIASLAVVIALVVFAIYALDRPFTGITRVHPDAFELRLETFTQNPERS